MDLEIEAIKTKITELKAEHRLLDDDIRRLEEGAPFNPIEMQRLKRRKLALKDLLARLESKLLPDIIA
ncbi:MAG: YdcH family protein [Stellaceae bacterium]